MLHRTNWLTVQLLRTAYVAVWIYFGLIGAMSVYPVAFWITRELREML